MFFSSTPCFNFLGKLGLAALLFFPALAWGQFDSEQEPVPEEIVSFSLTLEPELPRPGEELRAIITGQVIPGWHVYSLVPSQDELAPPPTKLTLDSSAHIQAVMPPYETNPISDFDPVIGMELNYHENDFRFYQNFKLPQSLAAHEKVQQAIKIRYQACSDRICLPPKTEILDASFTLGGGTARPEYARARYDVDPLPSTLETFNELETALAGGFWGFIALAVLSGFLALLTPCVFPMIPITVAFFTKQENTSYGQVIKLSSLFGAGIVGTYTVTGMGFSVFLGATGAIQLATNGYVNFAIGVLFLVFAFSLMGFFNLALPAGMNHRLDQLSRKTGGPLGIVLMGLVFTLTSFTCTVQFVGTMLIAASRGHWLWPLVGMLVFSTVFALPFFLLGLVPRLVQKMRSPSGMWLTHTKIVLGLVELAAAFKFFSNADLVWQWGVMDRDFVLYSWIILAFLIGLFLLGTITIHEVRVTKTGAFGFSVAFCFLFLGSYLTQGLQGTPLHGLIDAYLPPSLSAPTLTAQASPADSPSYNADAVHALPWTNDLSEAMVRAKQENKRIFVDFTGYTCVNCRWMEKYIFANPDVLKVFQENFVLVQLYTDGGDHSQRNQALQVQRFHTVALPFYVVLDKNDHVLARHAGIMASAQAFLAFLQQNPSPS